MAALTDNRPLPQALLARGPSVISADVVAADQRRRLLAALPLAVAEHGFEATTVGQIVTIAQVRRNSFYEQFEDKHDCFAAAYEIAQERLLGVLTFQCYTRSGLADRISSALTAGLDLLSSEPALTHLVVVEAPGVGDKIAARHHEWLDRYGRLLRLAAVDDPDFALTNPAVELAMVGGIVSRVKQLVLAGEADQLPRLCPELVQFTLSFYVSSDDLAAPSSASAKPDESLQPQSPERSSVLEPA